MRIFGMVLRGKLAVCTACALLALSACQDHLIVENKGALGSNIVRLGDTAVANVDGTNIYLSDVERAAAAQKLIELGTPLSPKDAVFQKVLDELIDQRLMALSALRQSLDQGDEAQRRLAVFTKDMLTQSFTDVAFSVPQGVVSEPFESEFGWHVLEVLGKRKGKQPSFEEMRDEILNFMTYDEIQNLVKELRSGGDVQLLFGQAITDKLENNKENTLASDKQTPKLRDSQAPAPASDDE